MAKAALLGRNFGVTQDGIEWRMVCMLLLSGAKRSFIWQQNSTL
jgi:hypothetical protein